MREKYIKSAEILSRAKQVTPLGAQTYSKSYRYYCEGDAPAFLIKGKGCYVWDVDNNKYIDFVCALGPITVGYNNERVNSSIIKQMEDGIIFSQPSPLSITLAEKLIELIPAAEMVRFVKNGSDATSAAVRLARAFTGRELIAVCGYHGMQDWYIGSTPNNRGVPKPVQELAKNFIYNDLESVEKLFCEYPDEIAAVILEPIQSNGPELGYLQKLKEIAHKHSALLIFDEVVSGFRYALGGASELYGITPDLAAFGKGMANGMPISAVVGRKDIINLIADGVFVSTTFGGEILSIAAALETIDILIEQNAFEKFWRLGNMMLNGLNMLVNKYELQSVVSTSGLAPHCGLQFEGIGSLDYLDIYSVYQQKMVEGGILTVGINNFNLAHTEKEIEIFLDATDKAFRDIQDIIKQDTVGNLLRGKKVNPVFKRNTK